MKPMPSVTAFALKVAAIVGMTCNHIANVFGSELPGGAMVVLYSLGGLTFPIMAYLLCEGYRHTSSVRRYAERLAVFAVVSQIPYSLLFGATGNVLITLLIGLGMLWLVDRQRAESCPMRAGPPWRAGRQFLLRLGHYRAAYDSAFLAFSRSATRGSARDARTFFGPRTAGSFMGDQRSCTAEPGRARLLHRWVRVGNNAHAELQRPARPTVEMVLLWVLPWASSSTVGAGASACPLAETPNPGGAAALQKLSL